MKSKCYHTCEYSHTSRSPKPFSPTLMGSATSFCPALDEKQPNTAQTLGTLQGWRPASPGVTSKSSLWTLKPIQRPAVPQKCLFLPAPAVFTIFFPFCPPWGAPDSPRSTSRSCHSHEHRKQAFLLSYLHPHHSASPSPPPRFAQ